MPGRYFLGLRFLKRLFGGGAEGWLESARGESFASYLLRCQPSWSSSRLARRTSWTGGIAAEADASGVVGLRFLGDMLLRFQGGLADIRNDRNNIW